MDRPAAHVRKPVASVGCDDGIVAIYGCFNSDRHGFL